MPTISFQLAGGVNYADQLSLLIRRAFEAKGDGSYEQVAPYEFPDARNVDYFPEGFGKRKGSEQRDDLTTLMATVETAASVAAGSERLIRGITYTQAAGSRTEVIVGKYGIYVDTGSGFVVATTSAAATYYHAAAVTNVGFAVLDGRLFIGLSGANKIQILRSGTQLDAQLASGNNYTRSYGGGTDAISGTYDNGCSILFSMHGRLCYVSEISGPTVVQYTPANQPWNRTNGSFAQMGGKIVAAGTFSRRRDNMLNEVLFALTSNGVEFLTGFTAGDAAQRMAGGECVNQNTWCLSKDWLMWLTVNRTIEMADLTRVDDLGRRFRAQDDSRGPFTTIDISGSRTSGFMRFDKLKKQMRCYYSESSDAGTSHVAGLDFNLGEPGAGELLDAFEKHVRPFVWTIASPQTNAWFVDEYDTDDGMVGIAANGFTYLVNSGLNDLDSFAIDWSFDLPNFDAGAPTRIKEWGKFSMRSLPSGAWDVNLSAFLDYSDAAEADTLAFEQVGLDDAVYGVAVYDVDSYATSSIVSNADYWDLASFVIRIQGANAEADHDAVIVAMELEYLVGAEQD